MTQRRKGHLTQVQLHDTVDKLLHAVGKRITVTVKRYVARYANDVTKLCTTSGRKGFTAVTSAADLGYTEMLKIFREALVSLCEVDRNGWTALHLAVRTKRTATVKYLLSTNLNIDLRNKKGFTALHVAVRLELANMVELLLENGADIAVVAPGGWVAIHFAAERGRSDLIEILRSSKAKVKTRSMSKFDQNLQTETGCTAMFIACQNDHVDVVTCLSNDMGSILLRNKAGWSPIHIAASQGHTKVIQVVGMYLN